MKRYEVSSVMYIELMSFNLSNAGKKRLRWHRHINAFFGLKTVVIQKSIDLGMISARHTINRQSFKKVTCPFKVINAEVMFWLILAYFKRHLRLMS